MSKTGTWSKILEWLKPPIVTREENPWGWAYKVHWRGKIYGTSCNGTLWHEEWPQKYGNVSFYKSEQLRRIVRRRLKNRKITTIQSDKWDFLNEDPAYKAKIWSAGAIGRENAAKTGLLP